MLSLHPETKEWNNLNQEGNPEHRVEVSKGKGTLKLDFTTLKRPQANTSWHANTPSVTLTFHCPGNLKHWHTLLGVEEGLRKGHGPATFESPFLPEMRFKSLGAMLEPCGLPSSPYSFPGVAVLSTKDWSTWKSNHIIRDQQALCWVRRVHWTLGIAEAYERRDENKQALGSRTDSRRSKA